MVVPALVYLAVAWQDPSALRGWAVPVATDIAFALAVLAVIGSALPTALRAFLLTLAIVDDLGRDPGDRGRLHVLDRTLVARGGGSRARRLRLAAAPPDAQLAGCSSRSRCVIWALVHDSGIHATIAGVALGLLTRVRPDPDEDDSPAERPRAPGPAVVRRCSRCRCSPCSARGSRSRPDSLGRAIPRPGCGRRGRSGWSSGKFVGVLGGTWLTARLTRAELSPDLGWADVAAVALLAGIGFTVSLLIGDLAFADDGEPGGQRQDGGARRLRCLVGRAWPACCCGSVQRRRSPTCREPGRHGAD